MGPRMGSCVCGAPAPHSKTQNLGEKGRMLLSASILLLGCSSAFADEHGNSMGCCEVKRVPGSMPKSGVYYLDTEYSGSLPDVCKNSCVYNGESGPAKYCFSASSTYTAECQDSGEQGAENDITGGGNGTLSYMQCNGEPDGTSCTKMCTADDCRPPQAKCCNGCCRRGRTLADYGCETK